MPMNRTVPFFDGHTNMQCLEFVTIHCHGQFDDTLRMA